MDLKNAFNQVGDIAQNLVTVIWRVLRFIWDWSFGQVARMFSQPLAGMAIWKVIIYVLVIGALIYLIYKIAKDLLRAVQSILSAIVGLVSALIGMLPQVVLAGLIAFGGAWIVNQPSPSWMPSALTQGK